MVGTATSDPTVASFAAPPSTVIVEPGDADKATVTADGVRVALAPSRPTPLVDAGFVLPVSPELPAGYLGKVDAVSGNGREVQLAPAGLADAFDFYKIEVDLGAVAPITLHPTSDATASPRMQTDGAPFTRLRALRPGLQNCLGGSLAGSVALYPTIRPSGHFSSSLVKKWGKIPVGATFDMSATIDVGLTADLDVAAAVSCGIPFQPVIRNIALVPVPIALAFDPTAEISIGGQVRIKNLGYSATGGFWTKGEIGARNAVDGGLIKNASPTTPSRTWAFPLTLTLGGELTVGPGGGVAKSGVVAGVGGRFVPLKATFGPQFDAADPRRDACVRTTIGLESELNVNAKAWYGNWSISQSLTLDQLRYANDYAGPWFLPKDCDKLPAPEPSLGTPGPGDGPPVHPPDDIDPELALADATHIALGGLHSCARRVLGEVVCWGMNDNSQLGDRTRTTRLVPVPVVGLGNPAQLTAGHEHTCARYDSGSVVCWGDNYYGALGDGTAMGDDGWYFRMTPVPVKGLVGATEISARSGSTCARLASGSVMCWGFNGFGQLGDGTTDHRPAPVAVNGTDDAVAISVGSSHACAVRSTGSVVCWGSNEYGQLGDGTTADRHSPQPVDGMTDAVGIAAGSTHSCARRATGAVVCWGRNSFGELGDGTTQSRLTATPVAGLGDAVELTVGGHRTCARRTGGSVMCWGFGQLGDGSDNWSPRPVAVSGLSDAVEISSTSWAHSCARRATGVVVCWGNNDRGQLGDGTTVGRMVPTAVRRPM